MPKIELINNDCLIAMKDIPDGSIDAIVTDPPYELGFMGKKWDASGIAYNVDVWRECLRVLKPGGHLLAFGGTRTYHRMACAIEDSGFEVRDMLEWIYASGFPKSLNVSKTIDKQQGYERERIKHKARPETSGTISGSSETRPWIEKSRELGYHEVAGDTPVGNNAKQWEGFGTALKPAHEPICMARKPLSEKTIVENVLKHGTGAIDIDRCRIPTQQNTSRPHYDKEGFNCYGRYNDYVSENHEQGRFPANILCTDDALNDGVIEKSGIAVNRKRGQRIPSTINYANHNGQDVGFGDSGSKSRYFDIDVWGEKHGLLQFPKASKRERNKGCEGLESKESGRNTTRRCGNCGKPIIGLSQNDKCVCDNRVEVQTKNQNHHPTVKPVHLMAWLVRLVTPPNGTCLDPFMGSGTTGVACKNLNRNFIGIELDPEYFKIAEKRIQG